MRREHLSVPVELLKPAILARRGSFKRTIFKLAKQKSRAKNRPLAAGLASKLNF